MQTILVRIEIQYTYSESRETRFDRGKCTDEWSAQGYKTAADDRDSGVLLKGIEKRETLAAVFLAKHREGLGDRQPEG
jgi:hypothetical protein